MIVVKREIRRFIIQLRSSRNDLILSESSSVLLPKGRGGEDSCLRVRFVVVTGEDEWLKWC